jgi:hypothetical protein
LEPISDAIEVAGRFGVSATRAVRYECDSEGTKKNFSVMFKGAQLSQSLAHQQKIWKQCSTVMMCLLKSERIMRVVISRETRFGDRHHRRCNLGDISVKI